MARLGEKLAEDLGVSNPTDQPGILTPSLYGAQHGNVAGLHKEDYATNSINYCTIGQGMKIWTGVHSVFTNDLMRFTLLVMQPKL